MKKPISTFITALAAVLFFMGSENSYSDPISFIGKLTLIEEDNGGGVYSGSPLGTSFSGVIDDITANGHITDGITFTAFGCCIAAGALDLDDNTTLSATEAGIFNSIAETDVLSGGQLVDFVDLEGDLLLANGNRIEVGLNLVFDGNTFNGSVPAASLDSFEPIVTLFFIYEEDSSGDDVYSGVGRLLPTPPAQTTDTDSGGSTDASLSLGVTTDAGASYTDDVSVGNTVSINAIIEPDSSHIGEDLTVVVAVQVVATGEILLLTPQGLFPFTSTFLPFSTIASATVSNTVSILDSFVATSAEVGNYLVYLGYLVAGGGGAIYYTIQPAQLNVE